MGTQKVLEVIISALKKDGTCVLSEQELIEKTGLTGDEVVEDIILLSFAGYISGYSMDPSGDCPIYTIRR